MNIALILSGGTGTRLGGDILKQYIEAGGHLIISYCIACLSMHEGIDKIQIVADPVWRERILGCLDGEEAGEAFKGKFSGFSAPGQTRQLSILSGLKDIIEYAGEEDCVLIHDAARPLLTKKLVSECLDGMKGHDGVLPVLPMKDTVYVSKGGGRISSLIDRKELFAGQAPELFRLGPYLEANRRLLPEKILEINGSTEPAILAGMDIVMIPGDENNFKITTRADLERFRGIVCGTV